VNSPPYHSSVFNPLLPLLSLLYHRLSLMFAVAPYRINTRIPNSGVFGCFLRQVCPPIFRFHLGLVTITTSPPSLLPFEVLLPDFLFSPMNTRGRSFIRTLSYPFVYPSFSVPSRFNHSWLLVILSPLRTSPPFSPGTDPSRTDVPRFLITSFTFDVRHPPHPPWSLLSSSLGTFHVFLVSFSSSLSTPFSF